MPSLPTIDAPCFLCGAWESERVWSTADRAFAVPGRYSVVRCLGCGFLYQRPRVRDENLADCYPDHYPRHQEPSPRIPFKGSAARVKAARWALATALHYAAFQGATAGIATRLRARLLLRRLRWDCPPWTGQGRYLDVGCGSGGSLGAAKALGWRVTGIEMDRAAAERARRFTEDIHAGDILGVSLPGGSFDVVTAFHVLEHVPDPVAVVRRMLAWLAPGGLAIIEVPNAGGLGASLFGPAWSGLELPRHLCHFTPGTLGRAVEQAGGRIVWCWHQAKPRYYLWSLGHSLRDRGWDRMARATEQRPVYGALKLFLEVMLPLCRWARRGEVIRIGIVAVTTPGS
ncbi:MAG TPA: class I SAM-dependent methyltransferase [Candidatus Methylomirabilis sp.]|nr:class I SAM-dependent methyltransferase [Candidatus Methylomirabilis sp.]